MAKNTQALGGYQRPKRAAAEECLKFLHQNDHQLFKKAKAEETKLRKQNALDNADGAFSVMPEKDKSIQVHKVYEFQFFDNFTAL